MINGYDLSNRLVDGIGSAIGSAISGTAGYIGGTPLSASDTNERLSKMDLAQSQYDFRYLVFPNDIGMDNNGHYMVININVPTKLGSDEVATAPIFQSFQTLLGPTERSKVDTLREFTSPRPINTGSGGNAPTFAIPRATRRIAESIALFMPTPLAYTTHNVYEDISLTALGGKLLSGSRTLAGAVNTVSTGATLAQSPINPMVEILFSTTAVRQFLFEVLMAPRNEAESIAIHSIIKTLRMHGAPEINQRTRGFTWIPPAEFDITFFNKGVENMNILRINTCVLERVELDYAPSGIYSTFTNGHPVAVRMSLGFRELEPVHKLRVLQGF